MEAPQQGTGPIVLGAVHKYNDKIDYAGRELNGCVIDLSISAAFCNTAALLHGLSPPVLCEVVT